MDWTDKSLLFLILLYGLLFLSNKSDGAVDSSESTALKFCECMMDLEMKSPYFSSDDKENMVMVAQIMTASMRRLRSPEREVPLKVFLSAFATSMISIVISEPDTKEQRKEAHMSALQHCSQAITGSVDIDYLKENLKLITAFERSKIYGGALPFSAYASQGDIFQASQQFFPSQPPTFSDRELHDAPSSAQSSYLQEQTGVTSSNPHSSGSATQIQLNQNIETVMTNTFMNSATFINIFNPAISVELATNIAKGITKVGMNDYSQVLVNETVAAVSTTISNMRPQSTSFDYARALSKVVTTLLNKYNITHPDHGSHIAKAMILHLEAIARKRFNIETLALRFGGQIPDAASYEMLSAEIESGSSQATAVSFESDLTASLSQSSDISNLFCADSLPALRSDTTYMVIKAGLADFDERLSSETARASINEFSKLSAGTSCSDYIRIISKIVTNILQSNEMLSKTDAATIVKKMVECLQRVQSHKIQRQTELTSHPSQEPSMVSGILQPSFPTAAHDFQQPVQQSNMPSDQSFKTLLPELSVSGDKSDAGHAEISPTAVQPQQFTPSLPSSSFEFERPLLQPRTTQPEFEAIPPNIPISFNRNIPGNMRFSFVPTVLAQNLSEEKSMPPNVTSVAYASNKDGSNPSTSQSSFDVAQSRESQTTFNTTSVRSSRSNGNFGNISLETSVATLSPCKTQTSTTLPGLDNLSEKMTNPQEQFSTTVSLYREVPTTEVPYLDQISPTAAFLNTTSPEYYLTDKTTTPSFLFEKPFQRPSFADNSEFDSKQKGNTPVQSEEETSLRSSEETHDLQKQHAPSAVTTGGQSSMPIKQVDQQQTYARPTSELIDQEKQPQSTNATSKTDVQETSGEYDDEESSEEKDVDMFYFEDPSVEFAREVTNVALASMSYIKSSDVDFNQLCIKVNEFAPVLDIQPIMNCSAIEVIHYLLNVLRMVTKVLSSV